jgi:potassium inwardly-rectifying channel subfamily J
MTETTPLSSPSPGYASLEDQDLHDLYENRDYHIQNQHRSKRVSWLPSLLGLNEVEGQLRDKKKLTRLLDRDGTFNQSLGRMSIRKRIHKLHWRSLYGADLFHSLVDAPSVKCIMILLGAYNLVILAFSFIYFYLSYEFDCNLGLVNWGEAFMFSLETMATIGYSTKDIFFDDCWTVGLALSAQVSIKLIADAVTIGVIYCRLSRPTRRASTVLFSNQAVIRRIKGKLYLMMQCCELRKHQLAEAHVRMYTIRRDRDLQTGEMTHFQTISMRLNHPDDELGGMMLLCLPQCVVHEINAWSPIMPPQRWRSEEGSHEWEPSDEMTGHEAGDELGFPSVLQRPAPPPSPLPPSDVSRGGTSPVRQRRRGDGLPRTETGTGTDTTADPAGLQTTHAQEQASVMQFMRDRRAEVVVIVEGTDAATGGTVQARHSYILDDIAWNHKFPPCVREDKDGAALIDFGVFHQVEPCDPLKQATPAFGVLGAAT